MDERYSAFCVADPNFYDSPAHTRGDDVDFSATTQGVPDGWIRMERDDWLVYHPDGASLPPQGWKIHASASLDDAERILDITYDYCVARRISFKFIRSLQLLWLRNGKYADRSASGKFITIYPRDDRELETILTELGERLDGLQGPYILSDLRWSKGPLYVRYGGFAERYCVGPTGSLVLAIADGDGTLVPDRRGPTFSVPSWVTLPECLRSHLAARNAVTVEGLPYRLERVLHFSNGGGLYLGADVSTGERVVLKEARPFAGLAGDRADAVTRLEREQKVLERLAGLEEVPALRGHFVLGDHHFIALDFIEGEPLGGLLVERYPITATEVDSETARDYATWALDTYRRVEAAVDAVHRRGIVYGDIHPSNVLVRPDGRVVLIDFEVAAELAEGRRPTLADPAFIAPSDRSGTDIDRYALACLRLYMFLPLTRLLVQDRGKVRDLAAAVAGIFPVPLTFLDEAVRTITGDEADAGHAAGSGHAGRDGRHERRAHRSSSPHRLAVDPERWPEVRESMVQAIVCSSTLQRDDRLFPGDIRQFDVPGGGLNLAHGAAGVLYALAATGAGRFPDHEEWLVRRALRPKPGTMIGFYDGLHGIAHVLHRLGHRREAHEVLAICADELEGRMDRLGLDMRGGLAGIGLNLAWFADASGDSECFDAAWKIAANIADRLGGEDDVAATSGGNEPFAGLTRGSSGPALLFLRLYEKRPDPVLLELAATALRQDLRRCRFLPDGGLEVNEGWRTMPYLADGGAGIGFVLDDFLAYRDDEQFAAAALAARHTAQAHFFVEPQLFYGRAGMILYLARCAAAEPEGADPRSLQSALASQIRRLNWHALAYRGHLAFPGDQLIRLSMDLVTGSAGILLALGAALHPNHPTLPFLEGPGAGLERQGPLTTLITEGGE